jgi:hypothetical protein
MRFTRSAWWWLASLGAASVAGCSLSEFCRDNPECSGAQASTTDGGSTGTDSGGRNEGGGPPDKEAGLPDDSGSVEDAPPKASYATVVMADAPFAYWRLAETAGTTAKDMTGGHDGTYQGTPVFTSTGPVAGGRSVCFTGDDRVVADALAHLTPATWQALSMEVWVSMAAGATEDYLMSFAQSNGIDPFGLYRDDTTGRFRFHYGPSNVSGVVIPTAGTFYHLVITLNTANGGSFYVNGQLVGSFTATERPSFAGGHFSLGADYDSVSGSPVVGEFLHGCLAEAALYTTALTAERVAAHYAAR